MAMKWYLLAGISAAFIALTWYAKHMTEQNALHKASLEAAVTTIQKQAEQVQRKDSVLTANRKKHAAMEASLRNRIKELHNAKPTACDYTFISDPTFNLVRKLPGLRVVPSSGLDLDDPNTPPHGLTYLEIIQLAVEYNSALNRCNADKKSIRELFE